MPGKSAAGPSGSSQRAGRPLNWDRSLDTRRQALYLDVDGTILDLALTPEAVGIPDGLVPLLDLLRDKLEGAVAFVSGRTIDAIDKLFAPLRLPAIGVHGGEMRAPGGEVVRDERFATELGALNLQLRRALAGMEGIVLEDKHSAIALHYRNAPQYAGALVEAVERVLRTSDPHLSLREGKCVVEIRPRDLTKGAALECLMRCSPFCGRTSIYAGDDITDEDAFGVINRHGGMSIRVGDAAPTAATYRLPDPEAFRRWLTEFARSGPGRS